MKASSKLIFDAILDNLGEIRMEIQATPPGKAYWIQWHRDKLILNQKDGKFRPPLGLGYLCSFEAREITSGESDPDSPEIRDYILDKIRKAL